METIEFVTPSGHKAYIRPYLTFGQSRSIEKLWASSMTVTPGKKDVLDTISGALVYDVQDATVKALVEKVVTSEGKEFAGDSVLDVIASMKDEDGKAIYQKVDEITKSNQLPPEGSDDKKK